MIPSAINSDYPKFVPNQVLTSDNLNDLFGYLDEQERLTRTNLVGIGIVCGLEIKTGTDNEGKFITITKGTGVTSQGYLVTVPETTYHHYNQFDAVKPAYYDRFVNTNTKTQKMPLWELKQSGETEDKDNPFHALTDPTNFLGDKVVLLFVELLETNNKNCDPDSCDDKGIMVTVNFRPLLILKSDVETYLSNSSNQPPAVKAISLQELKMPRFDVAATLLLDTQDVFKAYQEILTQSNLQVLKSVLSDAWTKLNPLVKDEFPADPFTGLDTQFSFLYDGSLNLKQAVNLQYFYDLSSDLLAGYEELRKKTFDVVCECVPDESLFPRHLLIGEASGFNILDTTLRTRFIPSGAQCCCRDDADAVRSLFRRLVLMLENFSLDAAGNEDQRKKGLQVRATPSILGKDPLSEKAIPFYYKPNEGSAPLYKSWNSKRTTQGTAEHILSYNSKDYNTSDDFVIHPLKYDLEPSNFLRIEGHIGQDYRKVLTELEALKKGARLPIDIIALGSDTRGIFSISDAIAGMDTAGGIAAAFEIMVKHPSCFADLFLALDEWINKLRCCLLENRRYFYRLPAFQARMAMNEMKMLVTKDTAAGDATTGNEDTIGNLYEAKLKDGSINEKYCGDVFVDIATSKAHNATALVMMPYKIDNMISILPEHITQLDAKALEARYADLSGTSNQLRTMYASPNVAETMTGVDLVQLDNRLEMNCLVCLFQELRLLVKEFLLRLLGMMVRQKLGYYAYSNPGIQHKAGVTMGGTFILVYHEAPVARQAESRKQFIGTFQNVMMKNGQTAAGLFSGDQALLSTFLLLEEILFLQKVAATEDVPDEVLDPLVGLIDPGTVIADFYVPYLCAGSCTPTQLVVLPAASTEKPNQPPVARAGDSISIQLPDNQVNLDGTSSTDPDGTIQTYKWTQDSGPNTALIDAPGNATTLVSGLVAGVYVFRLAVTDNSGATDEDTVSVTVIEAANIPPVADAGEDRQVTLKSPTDSFDLDGSNSKDPEGGPLTYLWVCVDGPNTPSIIKPTEPVTPVTGLQQGEYKFQLTVIDNKGASASDTVDIAVSIEQVKTCGPLSRVLTEFTTWNDVAGKNPKFTHAFKSYGDVVAYFEELKGIQNDPVDKQIDFFSATSTPERLVSWMNELNGIIEETGAFRLFSLQLYRILILLSMYIVCIQNEDFNKAAVPMNRVFDRIGTHVNIWRDKIIKGVFNQSQIDVVKSIGSDIDKEIKRVKDNGEEAIKPAYLEVLAKILEIIASLP